RRFSLFLHGDEKPQPSNMKGSLFLAVTGAALAMAGPIGAHLDKRAMSTEWVYETVTETVTGPCRETGHVLAQRPTSVAKQSKVEPKPEPTQPPPAPKATAAKPKAKPKPKPKPKPTYK